MCACKCIFSFFSCALATVIVLRMIWNLNDCSSVWVDVYFQLFLSVWVDVYFQLCCMCYRSDIIALTVIGIGVMWQRSGSLCVFIRHCHSVQSDYSILPVDFTGWTQLSIDICTYLVLGVCTMKVRSHFHHLSLLRAWLCGTNEGGLCAPYALNSSKIW